MIFLFLIEVELCLNVLVVMRVFLMIVSATSASAYAFVAERYLGVIGASRLKYLFIIF